MIVCSPVWLATLGVGCRSLSLNVSRHYALIEMQRGILPDALRNDAVILIKACPELRLTHELRLATFMARQTRRRLLVVTTVDCTTTPALQSFASQHSIVIQRHKS